MKSALIALLACLLVLWQRQPKTKCKCLDGAIDHINPKLITDCQGYDSSPFCPKAELIVVTKHTRKCVNPESPFGKRIFQRCKDSAEYTENCRYFKKTTHTFMLHFRDVTVQILASFLFDNMQTGSFKSEFQVGNLKLGQDSSTLSLTPSDHVMSTW
uniref:Chemokine interleukin-8-like domain-containing protein n=1 Tax=Myripristis murdjan TaxID=586833 RepID=A0A667Y256_9TELE